MPHSLPHNPHQDARPEQPQIQIIELNLDEAMGAQALAECLNLLEPLTQRRPVALSPHACQQLAARLVLRLSYALLQMQPRCCPSDLRALAQGDLLRAQSLISLQDSFREISSLKR